MFFVNCPFNLPVGVKGDHPDNKALNDLRQRLTESSRKSVVRIEPTTSKVPSNVVLNNCFLLVYLQNNVVRDYELKPSEGCGNFVKGSYQQW